MVDDLKVINFGASFNLGFMTVQGSVEKTDYSTSQQKLISGGVLIPLGSGTVKLNYTQAKGSTDAFGAKLLGAGYVYDLSKRTSVYVGYGRIQNAGNTTVGGTFVASSGGSAGMKRGETSTGYDLGVRHNF
jgi:predicted porin